MVVRHSTLKHVRSAIFFFAAIFGSISVSFAQSGSVSRIDPSPAFSTERLVSLPRQDWITNGGNVFTSWYEFLRIFLRIFYDLRSQIFFRVKLLLI